nr:hypothetical protein [Candidatus Levybacteria bacterium]
MEPKSPEISTSSNITLLKDRITEISEFAREITVKADNIGASKWQEMLTQTKSDGKERRLNVFYNLLTKKFTPGNTVVGTAEGFKTGADVPIEVSDIGLKGMFHHQVADVHTHPLTEEDAHLKTTVPSGNDLRTFLSSAYSAMVAIDRGGAHLLIKSREIAEGKLPPADLVQKKIEEIAKKGGVVTDVQKHLNRMFSQYGVSYFYSENLTPLEDGTITFKKT